MYKIFSCIIIFLFRSPDSLAEWLRRLPAKQLGSTCTGSNPVAVVNSTLQYYIYINIFHIELYIYVTLWRNWIAHWTSNPGVAGSNPVSVAL